MDEIVTVKLVTPEIVSVPVELPKYINKHERETKLYDFEREEIRKEVRNEYTSRIEELEANVLAYQDLLIVRETAWKEEINGIIVKINDYPDIDEKFAIELKLQIKKLEQQIVDLKYPIEDRNCPACYDGSSDRKGRCSKGQLIDHVFSRIDLLSEWQAKKVEEIKNAYRVEFEKFKTTHIAEVTKLEKKIKTIREETEREFKDSIEASKREVKYMKEIVKKYEGEIANKNNHIQIVEKKVWEMETKI